MLMATRVSHGHGTIHWSSSGVIVAISANMGVVHRPNTE